MFHWTRLVTPIQNKIPLHTPLAPPNSDNLINTKKTLLPLGHPIMTKAGFSATGQWSRSPTVSN